MTRADDPDTSAVRRAPAPSPAPDDHDHPRPNPTGPVSRIVVLAFAAMFAVGAIAFLTRALDAVDADQVSPSPVAASASVGSIGAAAPATVVSAAQQAEASELPSVGPSTSVPTTSIAPCQSPGPSTSPRVSTPSPTIGASIPVQPSEAAAPIVPGASGSPGPVDPCADPADPDPADASLRDMPFVPVVRFWDTRDSISSAALERALRGSASDWDRVLIADGDRQALEEALGISIPRGVREAKPAEIVRAVKAGDTLGILRAADVSPSVRALGIDGRQLFGNHRVTRLSRWPLVARVLVEDGDAWRQGDTWTLVAGGDSFTDRGIYERVAARGKGVDYPFDGGTARVTGHRTCTSCPRAQGNTVPVYTLGGPKGIVRDLVQDADLAIANHEQPTVSNWTYHLNGTKFSGKPDLTRIFTRAGIDFMSLANNHIRDYGAAGVLSTIKVLDGYGIKHAGAGKDLKAASKPAYLKVNGVTVGIVSCDVIAIGYVGASSTSPGALPCKSDEAFAAIKQARKRADVLIVFPHWGIEFSRGRAAYQEALAKRWERMGVDLVVGAHSHIPGGIGDVDGMPVFYSMGNFIFDQNWSTPTMEGILAEMTFEGDRLVQIRIHPFLTHDQAQPNLLDPRRDDGKALMAAIRKASRRVSDW